MRGRNPDKFVLNRKDKLFLQELLRNGQTPLQVARRAQILLGRSDPDQRVIELGDRVDRDAATIWRVCQRYRQSGLEAALYDAPRSGRPPVFSLRRTRRD
jgi:hypothetical protein